MATLTASSCIQTLKQYANPEYARTAQRFFKTGKGEYGEGDVFIGLRVPQIRRIAKEYFYVSLFEIEKLLDSKIHEVRLCGLVILCEQYKKASDEKKKELYTFYVQHFSHINNWDLVDISAPVVVGQYLYEYLDAKERKNVLDLWIKSNHLWTRRVAVLATLYGIHKGQYSDIVSFAVQLFDDTHDLMHKASGWMLREVGKKDKKTLKVFLNTHASCMPRTMLRYSIEHFSPHERQAYLNS